MVGSSKMGRVQPGARCETLSPHKQARAGLDTCRQDWRNTHLSHEGYGAAKCATREPKRTRYTRRPPGGEWSRSPVCRVPAERELNSYSVRWLLPWRLEEQSSRCSVLYCR